MPRRLGGYFLRDRLLNKLVVTRTDAVFPAETRESGCYKRFFNWLCAIVASHQLPPQA
jgi:hypothetical protein